MRTFAIAFFGLLAVPIAGYAAVPVPSAAEARQAVAAYELGTWRYEGVFSGVALAGRLILSITEAANGGITGEALLLTPDHRLLAASAITGRAAGTDCRLSLSIGGRIEHLIGICSPAVLGGRIVSSPPPADLLTRLVFWWGDRSVAGEVWLQPGTGL